MIPWFQLVAIRVRFAFATFESRIYSALTQSRVYEQNFSFDTGYGDGKIQNLNRLDNEKDGKSLLDSIIGGGYLWGVPVSRRTIEVRLTRKLSPGKSYKPKRNLVVCPICMHYHEGHTICGNCYEKVKLETEAMQEAIQKKLQLKPVENEVAIVYQTNELNSKKETNKGKVIVDMEKPPPAWFSKNLLTKAYMPSVSETSEISTNVNRTKE